MRPRAAVASVQGTVSVGRIDSSQWNGIVTPPVGVSDVPTIEQTCIQRVGGSEDWRWSNRERWRERFLLVTGNTKAWRNATQTNIANKLPIQFSHAENIAVRRNDPASTFHQTFPSVLSTLLCLWQPAPSFPPFFFLSSTRVANASSEILGSWEGRCLPFLGEGGRFYFPEKSGQILENNIGEEVLKIVCTYVYIYSVGLKFLIFFELHNFKLGERSFA